MLEHRPFHISYLQGELERRLGKNPGYSLRAFCRDLRTDSGTLSSILSQKRPLSFRMAEKFAEKLGLKASERARFLTSVVLVQSGRELLRRDPKVRTFKPAHYRNPKTLDQEKFRAVSDWYHAAILELTFRKDFDADPQWISQELGISIHEARAALARLLELGLLVFQGGRIFKANDHLELDGAGLTSEARRKKQIQIRNKAISAIRNHPIQSRYMTTVTMCIDPERLPEARQRVEEFNDSLCAFLEGGNRTEVYALEVGLFSLQEKTSKTVTQAEEVGEIR